MKGAGVTLGLLMVSGLALSGCGGGETRTTTNGTVVVADVSGSAEESALREDARQTLAAEVDDMSAPAKVTLFAFNTEVGASDCSPVAIELADSDNSTEVEDQKAQLSAQAPGVVDPYLDCVKGSADRDGTDVFGGIASAANLLDGADGERRIVLITDGCSFSYDIETCSDDVADESWRNEAIDSLPDSMKPDLSGIEVVFRGLARGSDLQSASVQGLRSLYEQYSQATGTTITFED